MRSNRKGLAAVTLLGGIALGAAIGAGVTWSSLRHAPSSSVPHFHEDEATNHGEWVTYPNAAGQQVRAYVAYPERSGKAPVIIVIHENQGITDWEPTVADDFAKKGYIAIATDLLHSRFGLVPSTDSGRKLIPQLTAEGVNADLDATYKYATTGIPSASGKVGVIGFCWGGGTVWRYITVNTRLNAAVACYGPVSDTLALRNAKTPTLGVYGEGDARVNGSIPATTRALEAAKVPFSGEIYPGTGHGFMKPGRTGNGTAEHERARKNIDAHFAKYLEGK